MPRVVVKFRDNIELPYRDGAEKDVERLKIGPWRRLTTQFPGLSLRRVFTMQPGKIRELVRRGGDLDPTYRPANFLTFFYVDAPPETDLEALAKTLRAWPSVQAAYVSRPGPDPVVNAADDPRSPNQGYLDPAPDGIDAEYAWGFAGGDGAGQNLIDVERGWTFNHEDLATQGITLLHGTLRDESRSHGTAVLGEICAVDNALGCVGITPNLASAHTTSWHLDTQANAITAAIPHLGFGDVLLLEMQATGVNGLLSPVEVNDAEYEAIRLATALGIVVVEAGGNGDNNNVGQDLDTYVNAAGLRILNRDPANPDFRDSGAIIVTAASSAAPHTRLGFGPFGKRIDCFAWGHNVNSCSSNDGGATDFYTTGFNGTSSASPIITGAALAVQGMAEATLGFRFSPRQLRAVLSDPATGTPRAATEATLIGVMPNLRNIIDGVLNIAPDVYIRDFVGDVGEPHNGPVSSSPDVLLRPDVVVNPQATFGVGTENDSTLGFVAEAGQDNFIYVRVFNQGGAPAANVVATVYWSLPATLVTPDLWMLIGSVTIPNVPTGDQVTVSGPITWPQAQLPPAGTHACFVALIGTPGDPAPDPAEFLIWDNFIRFIRENNNVTWRNFDVEDNEPSVGDPTVPGGFRALPFLAVGAPDKARRMQLQIIARLPAGAKVFLEAPLYFLESLQELSPAVKIDKKRQVGLLPVTPHGKRLFAEMAFPAKARIPLRLLVSIPKEARANAYDVAVRQLWRRQEVGRVTWRLAPRRKRPAAS